MTLYLRWVANTALAGVACLLLAQSVNTVVAALLTPSPVGKTPGAEPAQAAPREPGDHHQAILVRNLFNASTLAPAAAAGPEDEVLEATELPLTLLGTAAADPPELSWAAIEDRESQQTLTLRIGDSVRNQAQVKRIERKRIVLEEKGELRELALAEPEGLAVSPAAPVRPTPPARRGRRMPAPPTAPPPQAARNPAQLFSEARILPKYDAGQMVGVQVSAIKPGSLFEQMGIEDGDVITELNGIRIDSPEQSAKILLEFTKSDAFTVQVEGASGTRTLDIDLPEP